MAPPKGHAPYPGCEKGGRPKIYTKEFVDKEADLLEEWMKDKNNLFIGDFCFNRPYTDGRIDEFVKISDKFALTYERFKMRQKTEIFKGGLKRKFAHPMCALILSHDYGIHQKTEQKVTGDIENPLAFVVSNIDGSTKDLVNE